MSSSEEVILDKLLPDFQKELDVHKLKPYLKLSCSLTDEECVHLTENGSFTEEETARRLTSILKQKGSHCCARIMLNALRQSVEFNKSPVSSSIHGHLELIRKLEWELNSTTKSTMGNGAYLTQGQENIDSKDNRADVVNTDTSFFPSAVPESPFAIMQFGASASTYDPQQGQLNPLSWHSHFSKQSQRPSMQASSNRNMSVVISVGPSKEPVPLVKYHYLDPSQLESSMELNSDLIGESKAIQKGFAEFVLQVCSLLEKSPGADVERVRLSLSYQNCETQPPIEIYASSSAVTKAKTIPGLLTALSRQASWFNYELISHMAKEFCGERGQKLVESYEQQLRSFFRKLVLHCPPFVNGDQKMLEGFETMEMKVSWNLQACMLQDVAIFKGTVCRLLGLNSRFLVLKSIGDQQFQLSWAIPSAAVRHVFNQASLKPEAFAKENVDSVQVADNFVDFKSVTERLTSSPAAARSSQGYTFKTATETRSSRRCSTPDDIDTPIQTLPYSPCKHSSGQEISPAFPNVTPTPSTSAFTSLRVTTPNHSKLQPLMSPMAVNTPKSADSASAFILPILDETGAMIVAANEAKKRRSRRKNSRQIVHWQDDVSIQANQSHPPYIPSSQPPLITLRTTSEEKKTKKIHQFRQFQSDSIIQTQQSPTIYPSGSSRHSHSLNFENHARVSVVTLPEPLGILAKPQKNPGILWRILGRASPTTPASVHIASIQATNHKHSDSELKVRKGQQLRALYRVRERVLVETQLGRHGFVPYSLCRLSRKYYGPTSKLLQLSYSQLSPENSDPLLKSHQMDMNDKAIEMVAIKDHRGLTSEELSVNNGDKLQVLYCDNSWVYAVREDYKAGILPRGACRLPQNAHKYLRSNQSQDTTIKITPSLNDKRDSQNFKYTSRMQQQQQQQSGDKVGKIVSVIRSYVPKSTPNAFTIRKGLRVKVLHESGQQLYVVTKSGVSFWIPACYVRIAHKNSDPDGFLVSSFLQASAMGSYSTMTMPHSDVSPSGKRAFSSQLHAYERGLSKSSILFNSSQQYSPSLTTSSQGHFTFSHANYHRQPQKTVSQSIL